jgi:hypothetical protein
MRHPYAAAGKPNRTHAADRPGACYHRYMHTWRMTRRDALAVALADQAGAALATSHPVTQD